MNEYCCIFNFQMNLFDIYLFLVCKNHYSHFGLTEIVMHAKRVINEIAILPQRTTFDQIYLETVYMLRSMSNRQGVLSCITSAKTLICNEWHTILFLVYYFSTSLKMNF